MHTVKRIEIVADSVELGKIVESLEKHGASSYTIIHNVASKGIKGTAFDNSAVTMLDNAYVIAFCHPDKAKSIVEAIQQILNKFGGSCWISDVMEVRSVRCVASI
ncbi:P-II family nitrogen regulator [Kovacikia minuta CCNUW1]|uniref:P-II family nitrogen regulator n=1 Tax=Kovacikia minuta TaxID=2931930 RepID=UPI001CCD3344|nr:P-II family nitrogen regulator [Kovacikia minuta]UBF25640.1 P-II family nitrogen regulator [Kovacikia minuta CCNUW1]